MVQIHHAKKILNTDDYDKIITLLIISVIVLTMFVLNMNNNTYIIMKFSVMTKVINK